MSVLQDHTFKYKAVVIGSSLSALIFAYKRGLPVISGHVERPFDFSFFDARNVLGIEQENHILSNKGLKIYGPQKLMVWNRLFFDMSLGGQMPMGDKAAKLILDLEQKKATCVTTFNSRTATFQFQEAFVFDREIFMGSTQKETRDWLSLHRVVLTEDYDMIESDSQTENYDLKEILFYGAPTKQFAAKNAICVYRKAPETLTESKFVFSKEAEPYIRTRPDTKIQVDHREEVLVPYYHNIEVELAQGIRAMEFSEEEWIRE